MSYNEITAAFQHGRPDADLLLHETVRGVLEGTGTDKEILYRVRCAYAAAKSGKALRSAEMQQEV